MSQHRVDQPPRTCEACGTAIPQRTHGGGVARKYCNDACRKRATRAASPTALRRGRSAGAEAGGTQERMRRSDPPKAGLPSPESHPDTAQSWYHAKFAAPAGQSLEDGSRRRSRERLRDLLNEVSTVERCRKCGREILGGAVMVKRNADSAFFSGVESCGRIWLCPVCSAKVRNRRGDEVAEGVGRWIGQGHDAHFFTATLPHDQGDALAASLGVLTDAWRWMVSHKTYKAGRKRFGVIGVIKAVEITHGRNGWHPHIHAVVLVEQEITSLELFAWYAQLDALWAEALTRHGWSAGKAPYRFRALPVQLGDSGKALAAYVTKVQDSGLGNEMARADLKGGKKSSRTPFEILANFGTTGDADDLGLWHEYEKATAGKSAIRWSRGLRNLLLPDVDEATDAEIAAEEQEGDEIAAILPQTWYKICDIPGARVAVKEAIETDGWEGLIRTLLAYRVDTDGVLRPEEWVATSGAGPADAALAE